MYLSELKFKVYAKLRRKIIINKYSKISYEKYVNMYLCFRYYKKNLNAKGDNINYFTARPNPGAGIGHQMANWIAGYWFAKQFDLKFAHMPFSNSYIPFTKNEWDTFLGLGDDEVNVEYLLQNRYKIVNLPLFNENSKKEVNIIKDIIKSYSNQNVIFMCEQDQFYYDQFGIINDLKAKFYSSKERDNDKLIYDENFFNIAIHVRRGDIVQKIGNENNNLTMRWLDDDYFINALYSTLKTISTDKQIRIYLFSQGKPEDYEMYSQFENLHLCLDFSAKDSFLHMCFADALITSKSSFSYKPALLNRGIKVCPANFWHGYPKSNDWILLDDNGYIQKESDVKCYEQ